jgi:hypothetical protein
VGFKNINSNDELTVYMMQGNFHNGMDEVYMATIGPGETVNLNAFVMAAVLVKNPAGHTLFEGTVKDDHVTY